MDTLSFQKNRPLLRQLDLSGASLQHVVGQYDSLRAMLKEHEGTVEAKPESEALWFYCQNHAMSVAAQNLDDSEPMRGYESFVEMYHTEITRKTLRMFYYLLLICTRESRHASGMVGKAKLYDKYPNIAEFHKTHIKDQSASSSIKAMLNNTPDVTLGEYTRFLVDAFVIPSYGSGYGGKAWAKVARPLRDFVKGKITAEMLMDIAFTLAHNNGPIFNKGMLYVNYQGNALHKILDVQRSGQIPQLIAHHYTELNSFITKKMGAYVRDFIKVAGDSFAGRVDWTKVKNIKGKACYSTEIKAQAASLLSTSKVAQMAEKAAALKAELHSVAIKKGSIEIMPGVFIAKGERSLSNE